MQISNAPTGPHWLAINSHMYHMLTKAVVLFGKALIVIKRKTAYNFFNVEDLLSLKLVIELSSSRGRIFWKKEIPDTNLTNSTCFFGF